MAAVVAADLSQAAARDALARVATPAAFGAAIAVVLAVDVLDAVGFRVAGFARIAAARGVVAAAFDASVHGAADSVVALFGVAAGAAGGARGTTRAALFSVATAGRLTALAAVANAYGARIVVRVAFLVRAAFRGAATARAAARGVGVGAEGVHAQRALAAVDGTVAVVVAGFGVCAAASLLAHAVAAERAVLASAAAGRVGLVLAGAGKANVVGATALVVTIGVVAALAAVALAALFARRASGRQHAHAVFAAFVLGARIAVVAVFGAAAATEQGASAAIRARSSLAAAVARVGGTRAAAAGHISRELRAAAARGGLKRERQAERGRESQAFR